MLSVVSPCETLCFSALDAADVSWSVAGREFAELTACAVLMRAELMDVFARIRRLKSRVRLAFPEVAEEVSGCSACACCQ